MSRMLMRGLCAWAALLALALLFVFPMAGGLRLMGATLVLGALLLAWRWAGQRGLTLDAGLQLPAAGFQQPVVLVCGDGQRGLFDEPDAAGPRWRMTTQGCYLPVDNLEHLPLMVRTILAQRPHWGGQLGVLLVIDPGEHRDAAELEGKLRAFRHQLVQARRQAVLPLLQVSYLQGDRGQTPWFCWAANGAQPDVLEAGACIAFAEWQRLGGDPVLSASRLRTGVLLGAVAGWLRQHVQASLVGRGGNDPAATAVACGVMLVPTLPGRVAGNLWQQWVRDRTTLEEATEPAHETSSLLPLPDALLPLLPTRVSPTPLRRAWLASLWLSALAVVSALAGSAWHNRELVRQVSEDLHRYLAIPHAQHRDQPEFELREAAMAVLRSDAARLDGYYRQGEPLWLGLGLYQGERLRDELLAVITGYRRPHDAPTEVPRMPEPVRLDSLSLFAVGSATLKPESTRLLINALVDVKARPGWLIVIAGHTDASGDADRNLQLSRDRAGAVRDWMQRMGDIPDSCFAVQGFGAGQPIASNDTEIGRAANRRVDIRLVPEVGACVSPTAARGGKDQPHSAAVNL
ncbi:OmpA family protein [Pseudomonas tohonis]|uniref:OmpA family protein n=1 Tax=Pseudomonas tohonis TaxID=2725477 RepID=UPI001F368206|nr:OmpA family protein [Pseudomonas tohonis]